MPVPARLATVSPRRATAPRAILRRCSHLYALDRITQRHSVEIYVSKGVGSDRSGRRNGRSINGRGAAAVHISYREDRVDRVLADDRGWRMSPRQVYDHPAARRCGRGPEASLPCTATRENAPELRKGWETLQLRTSPPWLIRQSSGSVTKDGDRFPPQESRFQPLVTRSNPPCRLSRQPYPDIKRMEYAG
jgi:hypothetical protein